MLNGKRILRITMAISLCAIMIMSFVTPVAANAGTIRINITQSARIGYKDGDATKGTNLNEDQIGRKSGTEDPHAVVYYKADISSINRPIVSAKLKIDAKAQTTITKLSIYAVNEEWTTEEISYTNKPELGAEIYGQQMNAVWVDGKAAYAVRELDITDYVKSLQESNDDTVNIMLDAVHGATSGIDSRLCIWGVTKGEANRPYLEIEVEENKPKFGTFTEATVDKTISTVGVIDKYNPDDNVYEKRQGSYPDQIGTGTIEGVEYDKRIFYKKDLSDIVGADYEIISAQLVIMERRMKGTVKIDAYKVLDDWSMDTISYNNEPSYDPVAIGALPTHGYQSSAPGTIKEIDITDYIKTLDENNSVANIMLKAYGATDKIDMSHILGVNSNTPPVIRITYAGGVEMESLSAAEITGSFLVEGGTAENPQKATPILVLYNEDANGKTVEKIAVGEQKSIVGSGMVMADIDLTGFTIGANHKLIMYVWEDLDGMKPILTVPGSLELIE